MQVVKRGNASPQAAYSQGVEPDNIMLRRYAKNLPVELVINDKVWILRVGQLKNLVLDGQKMLLD